MSKLRDRLQSIVEGWDSIPIRVEKDGVFGSFMLPQLSDREIWAWVKVLIEEDVLG